MIKFIVMKLFKIVIRILCGTLFLLTGCTSAELSDSKNVTLQFQYTAGGSTDVLSEYIGSVTLYVYDSKTGQYIKSLKVTNTELQTNHSANILLDPGAYDIVCWGNVEDKTIFSNTNLSESKAVLTSPDINNIQKITTSDPLYYGKITLNVDSNLSETSATVNFSCAHIDIWVYVAGVVDETSSGGNISPIISITGLVPSYDFNMQPQGNSVNYYPESTYREDKLVSIAHCSVLNFNENTSAQVNISKGSTGELIESVDISKFISENKIDISGGGEVSIPILLEYTNLGVIIKMPTWNDVPVNPVW